MNEIVEKLYIIKEYTDTRVKVDEFKERNPGFEMQGAQYSNNEDGELVAKVTYFKPEEK